MRQKEYWDKISFGQGKYKLENWQVVYLNMIQNDLTISQNDVFLDIGCGASPYTIIDVVKKGCSSVGVDLSPQSLKKAKIFAKENLSANATFYDFVACSITHLPFKGETFSKTTCFAVLEHVPDDIHAIHSISRIMRIEGKTLISVPNTYARTLPIWTLFYKSHDKRVGHLRHYKVETIIKEFSLDGCIVLKICYQANFFKIMQLILCETPKDFLQPKAFWSGLGASLTNSKLWWKLQELDNKFDRIPTGAHFCILVKKTAIYL
jgi:ubiquinone/menaquinone biosynthesis C-methylase UbiE